jgi:hypothetical protein
MSYNLIYDEPAHTSTILPFMDIKCDNLRANNVGTTTINGVVPAALIPGINNQFLKTTAGNVQWEYFQLGAFSNSLGLPKSVLSVNALATQAEWSKHLEINAIDIADSNGLTLNGVSPLADQILGTDALGDLAWRPYGVLLPGAINQVYITNGLGIPEWSSTVIADNFTALTQLNSTNGCTLDNVNIVSSMQVASISPVASQVLGTDTFNVLGWQSMPLEQKRSIYYCVISQDINFALTTTLQYTSSYDNLSTEIVQTAPSNFTCGVAGTYVIQADVSVLPSISENEISIRVNGLPAAYGFLNVVSSFTSVRYIAQLNVADIVQIFSVRTNADPTAKLNLANNFSSPLSFIRIA